MRMTVFLILFLTNLSYGKDPYYPVSDIPAPLIAGANMVIRDSETVFTILAKDEARIRVRKIMTILNDQGSHHASEYIVYDNLSRAVQFSGKVYDARGELIRKLKKSDIYDRSFVSGFSLYEDNRIQIADLSYGKYPYTVEYEFEIKYKYLFQIPNFTLLPDSKTSVQKKSFALVFPEALAPRYKLLNHGIEPISKKDPDGLTSLLWNFVEIKPFKAEPYGKTFSESVPRIMVAPTAFEYEGYRGSMDSWENFGQWISSLNEGRGELSLETIDKIRTLVSSAESRRDTIKILYEYLQNKTRYVSIQLGIGGYQPFEASTVDRTGYGDCKALSNYMIALLDALNIEANYVLIRAGRDAASIHTDFTSSQFNHVIVAVPNDNDTIWLECTSQTNPFGYLGTFTGDRQALMITKNGARIVQTPVYNHDENSQSRKADVVLSLEGSGKANIVTVFSAMQYENNNLNFVLNQDDDLKKWILSNTDIPSFELGSYTVSQEKNIIPVAKVEMNLLIPRLGIINGKRIFLTPNLMNRVNFLPESNSERSSEIIVHTGWTDFDTVRYHIPELMHPEFIPSAVKIESPFGSYECNYTLEQGSLLYSRKMKIYKGKFSPQQYGELIDFYQAIKKADESKIVFLNKT